MKRERFTPDQIREAMRGVPIVRHSHPPELPPVLLEEFRRRHRETVLAGTKTIPKEVWKALKVSGTGPNRVDALERFLGEVFSRFNRKLLLNHFPPYEVHAGPITRNGVTMIWSRLTSTDIGGKTLYHFPDRPRIRINGGAYVAGFTVHALLRMVERFNIESNVSRVTFTRLVKCSRTEVDGKGFWIWHPCETPLARNIAKILANVEDPTGYEIRIGFCPVEFVGKFCEVRTVLSPSMRVDGINEALLTFDKLATYTERPWRELIQLDQQLPMVRCMSTPIQGPKHRFGTAQRIKIQPAIG